VARLFASWSDYAKRSGEAPGSAKSFSANLIRREFVPERRSVHGSTTRVFLGLRLRDEGQGGRGRQDD